MNSYQCIGNLGKDPEMNYLESGKVVIKSTIAIRESKDSTLWFDWEAWGKTAELAGEYLKKGSKIAIEGKLKNNEWEKGGVKHKKISIVADKIHFLDKKED